MQLGAVDPEATLIEWPTMAEHLDIGRGCLVRWRLADKYTQQNVGLLLVIAELSDRADVLTGICENGKDLAVLPQVAQTMHGCAQLLSRFACLYFIQRLFHGDLPLTC